MSDVRLSNGSPTLERMEVRPAEQPKPSACRNLFGPLDHEELNRDLKGRLREMEEAASAKWSFDFVKHRPIPNGPFEWQAVDSDLLPDFYKRLQRGPGSKSLDVNANHAWGQQRGEQRERRAAGDRVEQNSGSLSGEQPGHSAVFVGHHQRGDPEEVSVTHHQEDEEKQSPARRKRPADHGTVSLRRC
ncbi:hypothetical protein Z043_114585 [Scleropages formosus]|uniref:Cyclin-dependent kinase inhibitor 1B n=1 Tax=Scleropages formosus TaxID=113540 RepID=A0A0P7UFQ4_SCLFO|nr:hypothetical protein Z043_114585 [Scleropages formosus]